MNRCSNENRDQKIGTQKVPTGLDAKYQLEIELSAVSAELWELICHWAEK